MSFKPMLKLPSLPPCARLVKLPPKLGLNVDNIEPYGHYKAKINPAEAFKLPQKQGRLILVTAINPTPAGEGKTTVTIGLADALRHIGKDSVIALREPSLGPVFGVKGGAAGGGYAQVCRWKTSTCTLLETSMPSVRRITCSPPCSTTISTKATS